ncbi:response regulator [Candidatus Desantisbacteria bacterium]|nr:response regulator [Candidatus Desantisbacteria bacterium]
MDKEFNPAIKLLLVEDDEDFRSSLWARLVKRNIEVFEAVSAEEGLNKIKEINFDIVVSDIKLQGMDGMEFLAKVKEINNSMPVILLTGYASLESARKAVKLKASDYILKPLDNIEDLLNPINSSVQSYKLLKENKNLLNELEIKISELEKSRLKLGEQNSNLEKKNIALEEGVVRIETEKDKLKNNVITNIEDILLPIIDKLEKKEGSNKQIKSIKQCLEEISVLLKGKITEKNARLSLREIELCNVIKNGLTNKEISILFNITLETVEKHRKNIRHKLGIKSKSINLNSYLQQ